LTILSHDTCVGKTKFGARVNRGVYTMGGWCGMHHRENWGGEENFPYPPPPALPFARFSIFPVQSNNNLVYSCYFNRMSRYLLLIFSDFIFSKLTACLLVYHSYIEHDVVASAHLNKTPTFSTAMLAAVRHTSLLVIAGH